jgi:hypothetical protein
MNNERTITRGQVRRREAGCEGRLWETCELMDKNCIEGRRNVMSWHNTAKSFGSLTEVNAVVAQGSTVFLPGEASLWSIGRFQTTAQTRALCAVMHSVLPDEESAEGIVVSSEPVTSERLLGVSEECGQQTGSKARTKEEEATGGDL